MKVMFLVMFCASNQKVAINNDDKSENIRFNDAIVFNLHNTFMIIEILKCYFSL